jgi:ABC-2 type transport system ATP-binding protein
MKDGLIVRECNLEAERLSNKSFVELEITGDDIHFGGALHTIGADGVTEGGGRWRIVLPPEVEIRALWNLLGQQNLMVRKLRHRRDTLEEIFLKAMGRIEHTPGESSKMPPSVQKP